MAPSSPQTSASSSGGSAARFAAASECSPAATGARRSAATRCASAVASVVGRTPSGVNASSAPTREDRRLADRVRQLLGRVEHRRRPSPRARRGRRLGRRPRCGAPSTPSSSAASRARSGSREPTTTSCPAALARSGERLAEAAGAAHDRHPHVDRPGRDLQSARPPARPARRGGVGVASTISVFVTIGRTSRPARSSASASSTHERVDEARGSTTATCAGEVPPARRASIRSAGPFTARPPTSGLTATHGHAPLRERRPDRLDREDRPDRDVRVARGDHDQLGGVERVEDAGRGRRGPGALVADAVDLVAVAARDEPLLERERPRRRLQPGAERVVRRREQSRDEARGRRRSGPSPPRAARPRGAPGCGRGADRGRGRRAGTTPRRRGRRRSRARASSRPRDPSRARRRASPVSA